MIEPVEMILVQSRTLAEMQSRLDALEAFLLLFWQTRHQLSWFADNELKEHAERLLEK